MVKYDHIYSTVNYVTKIIRDGEELAAVSMSIMYLSNLFEILARSFYRALLI